MRRLLPVILPTLTLLFGAGGARAEAPDDPNQPEPEGVSWLDDWSLLPVLFYSPETDVGIGLAVIRSLALPEDNPIVSTLALGVIYTTKAQFITRFEPDLRFGDDGFVHAVVSYQRYPTRFFAEGAHPDDPGEPYDERSLSGHLDGRLAVAGKVRAGLRWEYRHNVLTDFVSGGVLERSGLPGLGSYFVSGLGPVLSLDTRDDPRRPTCGLLLELRMIQFGPITGADSDALQVGAEVRGYLDLKRGHVLAAEVHGRLTAGDLPFQLLPTLGGPNHLRGWYQGHLRGRHALLAQLEWRFPLVWRIGGAAFFALGEAVPSLEDLSLERIRAGGGVGLRYLLNKKQNVTIRLDLAWGSGFGAYVDVLEAF
jgi:hypothetical protein